MKLGAFLDLAFRFASNFGLAFCNNPLLKLARKFLTQPFLFMQYFLPFAKEGINKQIEQAILRADRLGVKIISLAALNKVGN